MDASVAGPRTRVLVLTSEVELMRLVRSVLEPAGCMVASDRPFAASAKADGPFDVVMLDLPGLDLDQLHQARRTYSDAHFIAVCGSYREADCIAGSRSGCGLSPSSLPPTGSGGARTRRRIAALQRDGTSALLSTRIVCDRPLRSQGRHGRRADRARSVRVGRPDDPREQRRPRGDLWPHPGGARARRTRQAGGEPCEPPSFASGEGSNATRAAPIFC